jgi:bla regulator protein BlaR1
MKTFYELIPQSVVSALGWTLVHAVWQGILLAVFASAGFFILRKKSAAARYNFGIILLAMQAAGSVVTYLYYLAATSSVAYQPLSHSLSTAKNWQTINYNLSLMAKVQLWLNSHLSELVVCWLIGTAVLMLRFAGALFYTEHLRSNASIVMDKEWRVRFGVLAARMNFSQSIEFRQTAKILTPMVIGAFRPAVLIPVGLLTGFSVSQVEAILAHELAHVRRNDYLVNLLQSFVEVVFFFHPALWWISERVRTEREHCCDDIAISICGDKLVLANALVKVAEWQSAPQLAMAFASKKPLLLNRIRRVLGVQSKHSRPFAGMPFMFLAIGLIAGVSFYAVGQQEAKQDKKSSAVEIATQKKDFKPLKQIVLTEPQTGSDTVIKVKTTIDSGIDTDDNNGKTDDNKEKLESLAQAYFKLSPYFNIDEIRSALAALNSNDIYMLSSQLPSLNHDDGKLKDLEKLRQLESLQQAKQMRMDILHLDLEKKLFDVESYNREIEKIEWAKEKANQMRAALSEKHSKLLHPNSKKGSVQLSDEAIEKQLAEFEAKIKEQQNKIIEYNNSLVQTKVDAHKAEVPYLETEKELELLSNELEGISKQMETIYKRQELTSSNRKMINGNVVVEPKEPARPPRPPKSPGVNGKDPKPAPVPPKAAAPAKPATPPAPPVKK